MSQFKNIKKKDQENKTITMELIPYKNTHGSDFLDEKQLGKEHKFTVTAIFELTVSWVTVFNQISKFIYDAQCDNGCEENQQATV